MRKASFLSRVVGLAVVLFLISLVKLERLAQPKREPDHAPAPVASLPPRVAHAMPPAGPPAVHREAVPPPPPPPPPRLRGDVATVARPHPVPEPMAHGGALVANPPRDAGAAPPKGRPPDVAPDSAGVVSGVSDPRQEPTGPAPDQAPARAPAPAPAPPVKAGPVRVNALLQSYMKYPEANDTVLDSPGYWDQHPGARSLFKRYITMHRQLLASNSPRVVRVSPMGQLCNRCHCNVVLRVRGSQGLVKILLRGGGGGPWEPPQISGGGVAERGTKGHTLISSIQMPEILPRTISKGGRGGAVHVHKARPPPPFRAPEMPERARTIPRNIVIL